MFDGRLSRRFSPFPRCFRMGTRSDPHRLERVAPTDEVLPMNCGSRSFVPLFALSALVAAVSFASAADEKDSKSGFHWIDDEEQKTAELRYGEQPALRYMFAYDPSSKERRDETYKVYHHVFGPSTGA